MLCVSQESGSFWVCVTGGTHGPCLLHTDSGFVGWAAGTSEGPRAVQPSRMSQGVLAPPDPTAPLPPAHHSPSPGRWGWAVPFTKDKPEPQGTARVRVQPVPGSASIVFALVFPPTAGVVDEAEPSVRRLNGTQVRVSFHLRWPRIANSFGRQHLYGRWTHIVVLGPQRTAHHG